MGSGEGQDPLLVSLVYYGAVRETVVSLGMEMAAGDLQVSIVG